MDAAKGLVAAALFIALCVYVWYGAMKKENA